MKRIFHLLLVFSAAVSCLCGAAPHRGVELLQLASLADRVIIGAVPPEDRPWEVTGPDDVGRVLGLFRLASEKSRDDDSVPYCQCFGDHFYMFKKGDEVLIVVSTHHDRYIRIERLNQKEEFDLEAEAVEDIKRFIAALEKTANQPPQRNAGSRPSSMNSPASETPSSLGPRG